MKWTLVALLVLTSCREAVPAEPQDAQQNPPAATSAASNAEPSKPPPEISVTRSGAEAKLLSVSTYTTGGEAITLVGSSAKLSCADIRNNTMHRQHTEHDFHFRLVVGVPIDGPHAGKPRVLETYYESSTRQGDQGAVELSRADGSVRAKLSLTLEAAGADKKPLTLEGTAVATHCGDFGTGAADRPQKGATATVQGKPFHWRGAIVEKGSSYTSITLSTSPMDCKKGAFDGDLVFGINLDPQSGETKIVSLRGRRLARQSSGSGSGLEVKIEGKVGTDPEVTITATGETKLANIGARLGGKVRALSCKK